jgi:L-lysine 2,3-aminomutase
MIVGICKDLFVLCPVMKGSGKMVQMLITPYVVHVVEIAYGVRDLRLPVRDVKAMMVGICKDLLVF